MIVKEEAVMGIGTVTHDCFIDQQDYQKNMSLRIHRLAGDHDNASSSSIAS
jgi:hypothetical protein